MKVDLNKYITAVCFFKWKEALYLPTIHAYHSPSDSEILNIISLCQRLDKVRNFLNKPINVGCWIRPSFVKDETGNHSGFDYNKAIGGAKASAHIKGLAIDFTVSGLSVDEVMKLLTPKLAEFELSAEDNGSKAGRNWIHLDTLKRTGQYRVFKP